MKVMYRAVLSFPSRFFAFHYKIMTMLPPHAQRLHDLSDLYKKKTVSSPNYLPWAVALQAPLCAVRRRKVSSVAFHAQRLPRVQTDGAPLDPPRLLVHLRWTTCSISQQYVSKCRSNHVRALQTRKLLSGREFFMKGEMGVSVRRASEVLVHPQRIKNSPHKDITCTLNTDGCDTPISLRDFHRQSWVRWSAKQLVSQAGHTNRSATISLFGCFRQSGEHNVLGCVTAYLSQQKLVWLCV